MFTLRLLVPGGMHVLPSYYKLMECRRRSFYSCCGTTGLLPLVIGDIRQLQDYGFREKIGLSMERLKNFRLWRHEMRSVRTKNRVL